jgi:Na+-transporting methylmalonyl-CoA/oxaloacetate decarboxylase gamma subunit
MTLASNKINTLLLSVEGVGIVFVVLFLAAYLGGLPTTNVLQDQPAFRIPLTILGVVLLVLILATVILAGFSKKSQQQS